MIKKDLEPVKIIGYGLSKDKLGLLAFFESKDGEISFYHIHSDELTKKEKKIHKILLEVSDD